MLLQKCYQPNRTRYRTSRVETSPGQIKISAPVNTESFSFFCFAYAQRKCTGKIRHERLPIANPYVDTKGQHKGMSHRLHKHMFSAPQFLFMYKHKLQNVLCHHQMLASETSTIKKHKKKLRKWRTQKPQPHFSWANTAWWDTRTKLSLHANVLLWEIAKKQPAVSPLSKHLGPPKTGQKSLCGWGEKGPQGENFAICTKIVQHHSERSVVERLRGNNSWSPWALEGLGSRTTLGPSGQQGASLRARGEKDIVLWGERGHDNGLTTAMDEEICRWIACALNKGCAVVADTTKQRAA